MIQYIKDRSKIIGKTGLCLYLGIVLAVTVFTRTPEKAMQYELMPFWSWRDAAVEIITSDSWFVLKQILVNVFMLMPAGIMLQYCLGYHVRDGLVFGFCFSLLIELTQLIFRLGLFEWDDMIHNAVGCMIGVWIMQKVTQLQKGRRHVQ